MILTKCAYCAAPNALTKCGHCKTRYCGRDCQKLHWKGGHRAICQEIKRAGGAEPYHANKKCTEAVAVAVEKCAADTKGQRCYICTEAVHWKTKEGLVRGCACRGTAGFAHVSCLAEQAKILVAEAEENKLDDKLDERFARWHTCSLCEQRYHGVVACALGWACWKTYVGRPETDRFRLNAMTLLGNGLYNVKRPEDALSVQEAELATKRRLGHSGESILIALGNLANTYQSLRRLEPALRLKRDVYLETLKLRGNEHEETFRTTNNYASSLISLGRFEEAKALLRKMTPVARRVLGESHELTLKMRWAYAGALYEDAGATLDDLREAVTTLEELERTARRVLGGAHPMIKGMELRLREAQEALRARESPDA